jgi:hypothetical protein
MLQDRQGNFWLGTKGNGLFKAVPLDKDQTKYHLIHYSHDRGNPHALNCNEIYSLLEDRQGRIWIGSFDAGLWMVEVAEIPPGLFIQEVFLLSIRHTGTKRSGTWPWMQK